MIFSVYNKSKKNEEVKLPDSAIRFRVLANSNSPRDQKIKEEVRDKMQKELYTLLENAKSAKQARNLITSNMDNFNDILAEEMKDKEYSYTIDYGMHPFPEKKYKGITYEADNVISVKKRKEKEYDKLADMIRTNMDIEMVYKIIGL